jgi:rod shape-determining protein MreC
MFSSLGRRRVIVLVVLTCLLLITLDERGNRAIDGLRSAVGAVLHPIDTATRAIALPVERVWSAAMDYDDLRRENEALRDQLEHMKGNDIEARSAILEYRELLALNNLAARFSYPTLPAAVVGESPSNYQNTVEINVGSRQGVRVGMPVTDGAGLIGRITRVYATRSIVLLITDPEFSIPARVLSTAEDVSIPTGTTVAGTETTTPSGATASDLTSTTTSTTTTLPGLTGATSTTTPATVPGADSTTTTVAEGSTTATTTPAEVVRETGTLEGQGADKALILRFIDSLTAVTSIRVGAVVDTAGGISGLAPQGIPIGVISRITPGTGTRGAIVEVTPNAVLRRLNFVAVVMYVPGADGSLP